MENLSKSDHQRGRVPRMVGPSQVSRHRPTISFRTTQITIVRGGGDHVNAFAVSSERFPLRLHRHALMPHSGMSCRAVMSPSPHDRFIFSSSTFSSIRNHLGSGIRYLATSFEILEFRAMQSGLRYVGLGTWRSASKSWNSGLRNLGCT